MKATVQILANSVRRSFKEGKFIMHECQCVVLGEDVQVGVLKINEKIAEPVIKEIVVEGVSTKTIPAGAYDLEYGLGVGWDDKELKGQLKSITAAGKGNPMLAALGQGPAVAK